MKIANNVNIQSQYLDSSFYNVFEPIDKESIVGTVLILHGMQEHSGRYDRFAQFLSENSYVVLTYDHNGHGKTAKNDEEQGFFKGENPAQLLVDNAYAMAKLLEAKYPDIPHFILGHSMGSFITRCLLQSHSNLFDGAIIVGTGDRIGGIRILKFYLSIRNWLSPRQRSRFINKTFEKQNNKSFRKEYDSDGTNWLSYSKENRLAFQNDSLCGIPFTNNGFHTLITLNEKATRANWAKNITKNFPMYFVSGADDPIGAFGEGIVNIVENLRKRGFNYISQRLYPDLRHEVLNENVQRRVYAEILDWLNSRG